MLVLFFLGKSWLAKTLRHENFSGQKTRAVTPARKNFFFKSYFNVSFRMVTGVSDSRIYFRSSWRRPPFLPGLAFCRWHGTTRGRAILYLRRRTCHRFLPFLPFASCHSALACDFASYFSLPPSHPFTSLFFNSLSLFQHLPPPR